ELARQRLVVGDHGRRTLPNPPAVGKGGTASTLARGFFRSGARPTLTRSDLGAADGQVVDAHRRQADAHRHGLTIFPARAEAGVGLRVVADARHVLERFGPHADQRDSLERAAELALLDLVGLGDLEDEVSVGDVDLPAAEVRAVDAAVDAP